MSCDSTIHRVCSRKSRQVFPQSYPQLNPQRPSAGLWKSCGIALGCGFPHIPNAGVASGPASFHPAGAEPGDRLRPPARLGYPSRVCSIMGDAIDRIVDAIDQLASDARGDISGPELVARVADIWLMLSALDPELARRTQGYSGTESADGAPRA